jgi:3-oxoacyl-[acyl-carrier protein] reductase
MAADRPLTVVTGSRKGLGRALAEHCLERGHAVVGCSRSDADWSHDRYEHVCLDVADEDAVVRLFSHIRKKHGRLDNVLNNAGVASMNHSLLMSGAAVEQVLATNVAGTFLVCREAARLMRKRNRGRIVNFASVATPLQLEGEAVYAASKAAVVSLTQILAREFAPFGVTVNAVGPSPVATDLTAGVPEDTLAALLARQAIPRMATADEVVHVVDFFLDEASAMVTGQTLYLGGV